MRLLLLVLLALALAAGTPAALAQQQSGQGSAGQGGAAPGGAVQGIPYTTRFEGLETVAELGDLVRQSSALVSRAEDPPPSRAALQRRADSDLERFAAAAHSLGYYDAAFASEIRPGADGGVPSEVVVTATPGPRYTIASFEVHSAGDRPAPLGIDLPRERIGLAPGAPARAADVVAAEASVLRLLHERGHPLAAIGDRTVLIDRDAKTMAVTLRFDPGPAAKFGPVTVQGAETVDATFVLRRLPWQYGAVADIRKIEEGRRALSATGVFDSAGVRFAEAVDAEGLLPVEVTVRERAPRTIGAGISASTAEGAALNLFWTHRNLFGGAERLDLKGQLGTVESHLTSDLRLPDVFYNDQDFVLSLGLVQEDTEGYDSQKGTVGGRFERRISEILTVDYGITLERSKVEEDVGTSRYTLVGLPVGATIDTSDDLLNPTHGGRSQLRFTPYLESLGSTLSFYSMTARHSHYVALDEARDVVLAGRAALGSIVGASTTNLPADKRLYSGGSGSVRGYGLHMVGPLDSSDDPLGGRSLLEFGAELRWRVYGDFGIVPFVDGGQVYDDETPDLSQELRWAAGLGFRYFTPIGPIRADIAFPLNPRDPDDRFQVYFSLGQAF